MEYIPPWKKLGLKLKYAKDTIDEPLPPVDIKHGTRDVPNGRKRKGSPFSERESSKAVTSQQAKKAKRSSKITDLSSIFQSTTAISSAELLHPEAASQDSAGVSTSSIPHPTASSDVSSQPAKKPKRRPKIGHPAIASESTSALPSVELLHSGASPGESTAVTTSSPRHMKRKSVSFTPETKTRDGDSTKQLYKSWLAQQDHDFNPTTAAQALRRVTPPKVIPATATGTTTSPKVKSTKKATLKLTEASQFAPIVPTLEYLTSFHTSRDTWKFNKSKQNQILKHALDISKIPPAYDPVLKSYMQGLQSPLARRRLRELALAVRRADDEIEANRDGEEEDEDEDVVMNSTTYNDDADEDNDDSEDNDDEEDEESGADATTSSSISVQQDPATAAATASKRAAKHATKGTRRETESDRRIYYRQALRRYKKQLKDHLLVQEERTKLQDGKWRLRLLERKRAELILWTIGEDDHSETGLWQKMPPGGVWEVLGKGTIELGKEVEQAVVDMTGEEAASGGGVSGQGSGSGVGRGGVGGNWKGKPEVQGKRKRKRKRRTGLPDDDSSSDESSSSSDSAISELPPKLKPLDRKKEVSPSSESEDEDSGGSGSEDEEESSGEGSGSEEESGSGSGSE